MTTKTGKWTDEEARQVVEAYNNGEGATVEEIAAQTGRTKRSVQGKLTSLKVYVVPEKPTTRERDDGPTKKEILDALSEVGFNVEGGEGATKPFLERVLDMQKSA